MASGRTISASFLTDLDTKVIELCETISKELENCILIDNDKMQYKKDSVKSVKPETEAWGSEAENYKEMQFAQGEEGEKLRFQIEI
ncbi:MAG: hypothetical protein JRJ44_08950 [Deltaproteobacteria bacterium]|nr:hypothetical protein [Deltaproteobacteria bacterium]